MNIANAQLITLEYIENHLDEDYVRVNVLIFKVVGSGLNTELECFKMFIKVVLIVFLQDFKKLKFINFGECESLVCIPDLSCTSNLEELDLHDCKHLVEAHESVAYHEKLLLLNLSGCKEPSVFPSVLESKNLRHLNLTNCS